MSSVQEILGPGIAAVFDSANHDLASETIRNLLFDRVPDLDTVQGRQRLILSVMQNPKINPPLFLHKTEVNEVRSCLDGIGSGKTVFDQPALTRFFSRHRSAVVYELSRLKQLIIFFKRIQDHYFKSFIPESIDISFHPEMNFMNRFLQSLELDHFGNLISAGAFNFTAGRHFYQILKTRQAEDEVNVFFQYYALFEAYISIARTAVKPGWVFPMFENAANLSLAGFYHPLIANAVANDFQFAKNVVVMTGPNMSGKSTMLKTLAICVLLAQQGFPIPARSAEMQFFDSVLVSVNTSDDLSKGYSQFFAEIQILKEALILARSGKRCFAVFDELFRGTNGEEGTELLLKTLKGLSRVKEGRFIVSTHIGQIRTELDREGIPFQPVHIVSNIKEGLPVFSYTLAGGWSELKLGGVIFKNSGLDELLGGAQSPRL